MRIFSVVFLAVGLLAGAVATADAETGGKLSISVSGLRNDNGVVRCGLYASPTGFREPGREMRGAIARPNGGHATCVFNHVPPGTYAVAVFHAEQNEAQMQYGLFGRPKQGYGFSRNASSSMGPPSFDAAAFNYGGANQVLSVSLQY